MITCPVCEHQQAAGSECEVCGKRFSDRAPDAGPVARLPELEQTQLVDPKIAVPAERLAELEATRVRSGPDLPPQQIPELERTQAAPAPNVAVQPVPDLDVGRAQDDEARTPAPSGPVTCRYCHNVQETGLLCDRCGMRLPRSGAPAEAPAQAATRTVEGEWTRCRECGSRARHGTRCGNCGHLVDPPPA